MTRMNMFSAQGLGASEKKILYNTTKFGFFGGFSDAPSPCGFLLAK